MTDIEKAAKRLAKLTCITSGRRRIAYLNDMGHDSKECSRALKALLKAIKNDSSN